MTNTELYMNGVGVVRKTNELIDALWKKLPAAICGFILTSFAAIMWCAYYFSSDDVDLSWSGVALISIVIGVYMSLPWWRVNRELGLHTKKMIDETARHGNGWAKS